MQRRRVYFVAALFPSADPVQNLLKYAVESLKKGVVAVMLGSKFDEQVQDLGRILRCSVAVGEWVGSPASNVLAVFEGIGQTTDEAVVTILLVEGSHLEGVGS